MPNWLLYTWLSTALVFSFIGQGMISFLVIHVLYSRYFKTVIPDIRDQEIKLLQEHLDDLRVDRDEAKALNTKLMITISRAYTPQED